MEILANNPINRSIRKHWSRRNNGYQRLDGTTIPRKPTEVTKFGSASATNGASNGRRRSWKLKIKLRLRFVSPLKLWMKLKNGYMNMMLGLAGNVGDLNGRNAFRGAKRIPKARSVKIPYSKNDFENRLIFEIYKSMVASRELGTTVEESPKLFM